MATIPDRAALLVDTAWLAEHLGDAGLTVVDIRGSLKPPIAPPPHCDPTSPIDTGEEPA